LPRPSTYCRSARHNQDGKGSLFWRDRANLAAVLIGAVGLLSVGGLLKAASNPVARWVTTLLADSNYGRQIGYMEDIRHDLEILEARLHEGGNPDLEPVARILVMVDDLDRCEPEKAVEMLQAVNLLLNFNSFIVCLGIDARILARAVEKHYEGLLGEAGASGYEYLDKIVQIPFQIPARSEDDIKTFIASQMGNPAPPLTGSQQNRGEDAPVEAGADQPTSATEAEAVIPFTYVELQAFETVAPFLRPNPRHLKRLINIYRLARALARARNDELILGNPAAMMRWLVMWSQWPYTALTMLDHYDDLLEHPDASGTADATDHDPLQYLLEKAAPALDQKARNQFDDEPGALRRLLALPGRHFTWPELRRVRDYTVNLNPAVQEQLRAYPEPPGDAAEDGDISQ
jgi:hypothetical protein